MSKLKVDTISGKTGYRILLSESLGTDADTAKIIEIRAKFVWASTTTITVQSFTYFHVGTVKNFVYSNTSPFTYTFGSGGSNSGSTDLGNNEFHYLYIDDSAVVTLGTNVLTATQLLNSTTAPTWNDAKQGWYNGNDRCIFCVRTDGSAQILEFFHCGDVVHYADTIEDLGLTDIDTTWTDVTCSVPGFVQAVLVGIYIDGINAAPTAFWRTNGQTASTGHRISHITGSDRNINDTIVITDTSQIFELKHDVSNDGQVGCLTRGWMFPIGM